MRICVVMAALGGLAACAPPIPESGAGFETSFEDAQAQQSAISGARTGAAVPPPQAVSTETLGAPQAQAAVQTATPDAAPLTATSATGTADEIAQETAAALAAASQNSGVAPVQASPSNPLPSPTSNAGISDENDFLAVSSRQTIESDAERLARTRQNRTVVAPQAVPDRPADTGPNVVGYALSTGHQPGERVYSRTGINMAARAEKNCSKFPSPDQAQIAFLEKGGPERDRLGLDPDGDGFACSWDPRPFRRAAQD